MANNIINLIDKSNLSYTDIEKIEQYLELLKEKLITNNKSKFKPMMRNIDHDNMLRSEFTNRNFTEHMNHREGYTFSDNPSEFLYPRGEYTRRAHIIEK